MTDAEIDIENFIFDLVSKQCLSGLGFENIGVSWLDHGRLKSTIWNANNTIKNFYVPIETIKKDLNVCIYSPIFNKLKTLNDTIELEDVKIKLNQIALQCEYEEEFNQAIYTFKCKYFIIPELIIVCSSFL